ncbi:hypothetical protein [Pacificibacter sp. AS14]|uniref:hypothetical protein n=1 Tax=Pacificibacter sp. AS14 TaxID=3135785 RepID=UPI0031747FD8
MSKFAFLLLSAFALFTTSATAQDAAVPACDTADCIALPAADDVQNFIPGIAPLIGGAGIFASSLLSGNSTTSTTSTTSTN